jgi:aminopeptidase-like protein
MVAFLMKEDPGSVMHAFIARLFPICRSITGDGVRETLRLVQDQIPIEVHEVHRHPGLRLERAQGVEYQRRLG